MNCNFLATTRLSIELKDNIREITIPEWNKVTFVFFNGTAITKDWQDKSRKWTDEMKAENYEKLRKGHKQ